MSRRGRWLGVLLSVVALAGCGGGDFAAPPEEEGPVVGKIDIITDLPELPSSGIERATITATVLDEKNATMPDVTVVFDGGSGAVTAVDYVTNADGQAVALLSINNDPTNRFITVKVTAGTEPNTKEASIDIPVVGTRLTLDGPTTLVLGDTATYTATLLNSDGTGIAGETLSITSSNPSTPTNGVVDTDAQGQVQWDVRAAQSGSDTITTSGLGQSASVAINVLSDQFRFLEPAEGVDVPLATQRTVRVEWKKDGVAQSGRTVNLSTTRGVFAANGQASVALVTDANGIVTAQVSATNTGPAILTATAVNNGPTTSRTINFIATNPTSIDVQTEKSVISVNEAVQILALVRDPNNNPVKNAIVSFSATTDLTGGSLSSATATTDEFGRAAVTYTAGQIASESQAVVLQGAILATTITDSASLTVTDRALRILLGRSNEIIPVPPVQYRDPWVAQVSDSSGGAVNDLPVSIDLFSAGYRKGQWVLVADAWVQNVTATCPSEDANRNGILDPGEDLNGNGKLDPSNVDVVTESGSASSDFVTDETGTVRFDILYPEEQALWLAVDLRAVIQVGGTEPEDSRRFTLPILLDDVSEPEVAPPGQVSPYGQSSSCFDDL